MALLRSFDFSKLERLEADIGVFLVVAVSQSTRDLCQECQVGASTLFFSIFSFSC